MNSLIQERFSRVFKPVPALVVLNTTVPVVRGWMKDVLTYEGLD